MLKRFLAGFAAVAMLTACSNDEPAGPVTPAQPDGDVAYMAITISAPDAGSRSTEDGGYLESPEELEHTVNNVQFLFFDANGAYVFTANADNTAFDPANDNTHNVEYIGKKCILILNGVRSNNYPEYVVTVLNAPADFTPGATMQETADKLATYAEDFKTGRTAPFVMTTSSFIGDKNGANGSARHDAKYFATKLNPTDFKATIAEAQDQNTTPVEIYVERLAAKVEVKLSGKTELIGDKYYYKISQTVAGELNNDELGEGGSDAISDVDLYISVLGWKLNATAPQSYMSKKLDWTPTDLWTGWNNDGDWRSFWAKAYTYGPNPVLNYVTPAEVAKGILFDGRTQGTYDYCYENTNAPVNIFNELANGPLTLNGKQVSVVPSKVTHVVLHTQIYAKGADGNLYVPSLVQYRGVTFTEQSYIAMILNQLKAAGKLNIWRKIDETKYQTLSASDFTIEANRAGGLGAIKLTMKDTDETLYIPTGEVDEAGNTIYREATQDDKDALMAAIAAIEAENPATGSNTAEAFYYIPIEHLAATDGQTEAVEGYYGVVRNHWYQLTINSFKKIGHLVFDPENDPVTPVEPDDEEDPMYYVGAKLNILSWKIVNQVVDDL